MYAIIFKDQSKKEITKNEYEQLMKNSFGDAKGTTIRGAFYSFDSISKILEPKEFNKEYPQNRPPKTTKELPQFNRQPIKGGEPLKQMIAGIKNSIETMEARGHSTKKSKHLLSSVETRLNGIS